MKTAYQIKQELEKEHKEKLQRDYEYTLDTINNSIKRAISSNHLSVSVNLFKYESDILKELSLCGYSTKLLTIFDSPGYEPVKTYEISWEL